MSDGKYNVCNELSSHTTVAFVCQEESPGTAHLADREMEFSRHGRGRLLPSLLGLRRPVPRAAAQASTCIHAWYIHAWQAKQCAYMHQPCMLLATADSFCFHSYYSSCLVLTALRVWCGRSPHAWQAKQCLASLSTLMPHVPSSLPLFSITSEQNGRIPVEERLCRHLREPMGDIWSTDNGIPEAMCGHLGSCR